MKLKEHEPEKLGMDKELYNLFIELINFEYNKSSFLKKAKFYCWAHGLQEYAKFFKIIQDKCAKSKNDFIYYILSCSEEIPEITINGIKIDFDSVEDVFTGFAELEETFIDIIERIIVKSNTLNDVKTMAFTLPILNKIDHIACRALEAVKNNKNPFDLVKYSCEDNIES